MSALRPIWLVEDTAMDIELTIIALKEGGLANSIIVMRDGSEAIERLHSLGDGSDAAPVVILIDIKMPRVSGIEVLRAVKGNPRLKHLAVVMLTSSSQSPDVARCYELGANGFVVKPVEFSAFIEAVKSVGKFWAIVNQPPESCAESLMAEVNKNQSQIPPDGDPVR